MAENNDVLRCPLCQGHGELRRAELEGWLSEPDFRGIIERIKAQLYDLTARTGEPVFVRHPGNGKRDLQKEDFQKEVHRWNPELQIFRRSPKE